MAWKAVFEELNEKESEEDVEEKEGSEEAALNKV